jgi:3D (Asp-Asp-Asp) domain-containing protein
MPDLAPLLPNLPRRRPRWRWLRRASRWLRVRLARRCLVAALASGCVPTGEPQNDVVVVAEPRPLVAVSAPPTPRPDVRRFGQFHVTFYYVIGEEEIDGAVSRARPRLDRTLPLDTTGDSAANDNTATAQAAAPDTAPELPLGQPGDVVLAAAAPPDRVTLFDGKACRPLAEVSRSFASELRMQGTGRLRDGRIINIWGDCGCAHSPCYRVTGRQWGNAGNGRALQPFRTVAVDPKVVPMGTLLYIEELDGRQMPGKPPWGGFVHDGCVSADDTGGGIDGHQLDLFVGRRAYYKNLAGQGGSHRWSKDVTVTDGSGVCERQRGQVRRARQAS